MQRGGARQETHMIPNDAHLRRIATEVLSHLPYGYEETLEVLGYLRQLAEWRHHGRVIPLPPRQAYPPAAAVQADR